VITIHQRHRQTDGQTDRQTTCDRNTALCTKVHRAVKTARTTMSFIVYLMSLSFNL